MEFQGLRIPTEFGDIPIESLIKAYATMKRGDAKKKEWLKTDEGKLYNREKSKSFYESHHETILDKRKQFYQANKEAIIEKQKAYYQLHREEILEANRMKRMQ